MQKPSSLKRNLVLTSTLFSLLLCFGLLFSAYRVALNETEEGLNAQMRQLAQWVQNNNPRPTVSVFKPDEEYSQQDIFVDVWMYDQYKASHTTDNFLLPRQQQPGFFHHRSDYGEIISYILPLKDRQIQITQPLDARKNLALELAGTMLVPYVLLVPFFIIGLMLVIDRSLKPLDELKRELSIRQPDDLSAIQIENYPKEMQATATEINALFERIHLAQEEQQQFIAHAAHELRTPITALNLQAKLVEKDLGEHNLHIQQLYAGIQRMQHLITQLLDLARQDNELHEHKLDISLVPSIADIIQNLYPIALSKELDLGFQQTDQVALKLDPQAFHIIMSNLLDNAIKYTPEKGQIDVSVIRHEHQVEIRVEDSGIGIAAEDHEKVMQHFYRVNNTGVGSGLGLSIVQKALKKLDGTLQFSASPRLGGLQVSIYLPCL